MDFAHRTARLHRLLVSRLALSAALLIAAAPFAHAQTTHLWKQSALANFENGKPDGVSLPSDGHLREGPGLTTLLTTPSTFVWSVAVAKDGTAYLGTQGPATVLRLSPRPGAKPFTLFQTTDLSVQVLRIGPHGSLYAATLPSGKVYKINPHATTKQDAATATLVFDLAKVQDAGKKNAPKSTSKPRYIWAMTFDPQGRLYIATGDPAAIYRVNPNKPNAKPVEFFKSSDAHIRSLAWDNNGDLIAGSDGSGLIYRINPQGKGYVLYQAPKREITALAVASDGVIYAAGVGQKGQNPLPPLPVQSAGSVTIQIVQPAAAQSVNQSAALPQGTQIYALAPGKAPHLLWANQHDIVYALAMRPNGLLALSGNRGRIYLIHADGSYADIGHLDAQQGLCLAVEPQSSPRHGLLIGSGNTGKLFLLGTTKTHQYISDVLDAGALARFGRVEVQPGSSGYQLLTRTGNIAQPERGWAGWQQLKDGNVTSPPGRFLQWKAVLQPGGVMGSVGVDYVRVQSNPVVDKLVVVPGARLNPQIAMAGPQAVSLSFDAPGQGDGSGDSGSAPSAIKDRTAVTVRWAAHDADGDKLIYSLYLRGDGESAWWPLKKDLTYQAYSFNATQVPDGGYQVKVVASDAPSEPPGKAVTGFKISKRFIIDTTPPAITNLNITQVASSCAHAPCAPQVRVTFDATDGTSPIVRADFSVDARPWQFIAPVGVISDSKQEHYDFVVPASDLTPHVNEHLITVRAYDRYDNVGLAKSIFQTTEAK
jgi:WD40 repeat protein